MAGCCGLEWSKVINRKNVVDMDDEEVIEMSDRKMIDILSSINKILNGTLRAISLFVSKTT